MKRLFKLGMSLGMAVLAVLVVSFAGLLSEARMTTILLRDVLGFVVAGTVVYLVMFLLEAKDIALFDKELEFPQETAEPPETGEGDAEDEPAEAAETEDDASETEASGTGAEFTPLTEKDFGRVETPGS
ncbi:MAG: hypothetical protein IKR65_01665 [Selenomonadaceae bacterium]|nr:hypothetical protein [Selenomonadaceae bacterium]MBR6710333.1 hypothetical protein [Selenomonadaceae bacterium]